MSNSNNFGQDVEFLQRNVETIVLQRGLAQIAVVPGYQGRTMTSTSGGDVGSSYGWINYRQIESVQMDPQINLYGGEDRFWLSPEGGQYSVFFDPGAPLEFAHWRTPKMIDTEPFELTDQTPYQLSFTRRATVTNYSQFEFHLQFDRQVVLLDQTRIDGHLGTPLPDGLSIVAHESRNTLTNVGAEPWRKETGLLGIWVLCMNKPSDQATILVPFRRGATKELGPIVNADYFGELDSGRMVIDEDRGLIFFLGDGKYRSKIGLTFPRAKSFLGSWDEALGALTIAQFNLPESAPAGYTNNLWQIQDDPYAGDVINSYNDGPNESGGMLGPFYELESLSPALELAPQQSYTHIHRTIHIEGDRSQIDKISQRIFGVGLRDIGQSFSK